VARSARPRHARATATRLARALGATAACASNGDAPGSPVEGEGNESSSSSSSGSTSSKDDRPTFDASFAPTDQDANVDPTPDGGGDTCVDNDDPGSAENVAKQLPAMDDCDNNFKTVKGVLNGAVDVDFYKVSGTDKAGCNLDTEFSSNTSGAEICVYARCKNATANAVTGCAQGVEDTSVIGMKGCCAAAPGKATPEWDCDGITDNDSADFMIRIKPAPNTDKCLPYQFSYRF
jgi:hypothetical protein